MSELAVGALFGRYEIVRVLGRGGFGTVYLASDTNPHLTRHVALKILDDNADARDTFRDRFLRESRLASALDHPNIVAIYDAGEFEGRLFISMRYVEGTDLRRLIASGTLDPRRTVRILTQVAAGLDAAHTAGVVHRDIKPANILLSTDLSRVYLADFGLTKRLASESSDLSSIGQFLGTFAYAAPEQLQGREVDGRADEYAMGCTLYECLTGRIPFDGSPDVVLTAHLTRPPPPVSGPCPWLPPAIDAVVARAMAKVPEDRYPTVSELMAAAENALLADTGAVRDTNPLERVSAGETVTPRWDDEASVTESNRVTVAPEAWPPTARPNPMPLIATKRPGAFNRRAWIGLSIAAGILVFIVIAALASRGGGPPKIESRLATAAGESGEFPTAKERSLLGQVPSNMRNRCKRGDPASFAAGAEVTLDCAPLTLADTVAYERFASAAALNAAYEQLRSSLNIGRDTSTDCFKASESEQPFETQSGPGGRMFCHREGETSTLVWTLDRQRILARVQRPDRGDERLFVWFASNVGLKVADFPNSSEQTLLSHVSPAMRASCVRGVLLPGGLAAVDCPAPDVDAVFFNLMQDASAMAAVYEFDLADLGIARDSGANGTCPSEAPYTRGGQLSGRFICTVDNVSHGPYVEWTDDELTVISYAVRDHGSAMQLLGWWSQFNYV